MHVPLAAVILRFRRLGRLPRAGDRGRVGGALLPGGSRGADVTTDKTMQRRIVYGGRRAEDRGRRGEQTTRGGSCILWGFLFQSPIRLVFLSFVCGKGGVRDLDA